MEIEEKVWDAFTDLSEEGMANVAEQATGYRVFHKYELGDVLGVYGDKVAARIIREAKEEENFSEDDEWMIYDDFHGQLMSNDDLMELLNEFDYDIITGILDDADLMGELGLENEEEDEE